MFRSYNYNIMGIINYYDLYVKATNEGIGCNGLCWMIGTSGTDEPDCFDSDKLHEFNAVIAPTEDYDENDYYWGADNDTNPMKGIFTPLRQNLLLLMAAYKGQL